MLPLGILFLLIVSMGSVPLAGRSPPTVPGGDALPTAGPGPRIVILGTSWVIQSWVNLSNALVQVSGNVTVLSGGHLNLTNSTLTIVETSNLAFGVSVESGGHLVLLGSVVETSSASDHTYLRALSGSTLEIVGGTLRDIGGDVATEQGLFVGAKGATVAGTTFNNYYEAIVVSDAPDVRINGVHVMNSTSGSNQTFAVYVFGTSSDFVLSNSTFDIPQNIGALCISSPYATVSHNVFRLDSQETALSGIYFGYADNGAQNANHSAFDNNSVMGTGFVDEAASNVTVWGNWIYDTGPSRPSGIMAEVPLWTERGLWVRGLNIEWNTISDYSRYGIRLQQNVSQFNIAHNRIINPSRTPGPSWTEIWGGPQIDAMYLIRGVNDGTVQYNYVDVSDLWYIATDGITLESDVSNVRVLHNQFYNVSQEGVVLQGNVPGFDNALPWQNGPSLYDTVANNLFDNQRRVTETNFTVEAILLWHWANHTTVVNNTFIGWENVPTHDYFNGAIVLTTASYGFYYNNTIVGARYGFVFSNFSGVAHPYSGEFNRSDNLVYGNFLSGITVKAVDETPNDGMGPLHNVLVVLTNSSSSSGLPLSYVESIAAPLSLSVAESGSSYTEVLRTNSPISGKVQNFTTWLRWSSDKFSVDGQKGLGSGEMTLDPTYLSQNSVEFSIATMASSNATVDFYPTGNAYTAHYAVSRTLGGTTTNFSAVSSGPLTVALGKGTSSVYVRLVSFTVKAASRYLLAGTVTTGLVAIPVVGAVVTLLNGGGIVVTNQSGQFSFLVQNGSYALSALGSGYSMGLARVAVLGMGVRVDLVLSPIGSETNSWSAPSATTKLVPGWNFAPEGSAGHDRRNPGTETYPSLPLPAPVAISAGAASDRTNSGHRVGCSAGPVRV